MVDFEPQRAVEGAVGGLVAFVLGFVATYVLASPSGGDDLLKISFMGESSTTTYGEMGEGGGSQPEAWEVVGWVFHKAHFASIDVELSASGQAGELLSQANVSFAMDPSILVRIVPIVLLAAVGFVLAQRAAAADPVEAAFSGAHVVAGYAPLALISVFLLAFEDSQSTGGSEVTLSIQPDLVTGIVLTGLLVPIVVGVGGGLLSHVVNEQT